MVKSSKQQKVKVFKKFRSSLKESIKFRDLLQEKKYELNFIF